MISRKTDLQLSYLSFFMVVYGLAGFRLCLWSKSASCGSTLNVHIRVDILYFMTGTLSLHWKLKKSGLCSVKGALKCSYWSKIVLFQLHELYITKFIKCMGTTPQKSSISAATKTTPFPSNTDRDLTKLLIFGERKKEEGGRGVQFQTRER